VVFTTSEEGKWEPISPYKNTLDQILGSCVWQEVIGQYMNDQPPRRETMSIKQIILQASYDKIKDQIVAKQKRHRIVPG